MQIRCAQTTLRSGIPVTETQTRTEMIDFRESRTKTKTENIFNTGAM